MEASAALTERDPLDRETPAWYDAAKLGIFIHWCPAAIPAYAPLSRDEDLWDLPDDADGVGKIWRRLPHAAMYQNTSLIPDSPTARYHADTYGDLPYDAFVERFREELIPQLDVDGWADVCARSGARYAVLTTKLPDGFLLWPSAIRNPRKDRWQSERDVVGEAAAAIRSRGMRFGTYYCGGTDGTFGRIPITSIETMIEALPPGEEYRDYATGHWRELIAAYEPSVLWNDFCFPGGDDHVRELLSDYVQQVPDGVVNNRFQGSANSHMQMSPVYSDFITPEYSTDGGPQTKWEACRSIGLSFGYNAFESDSTYLTDSQLIHMFVDVVARGGNLLLNISPSATGKIPWGEARRLAALGCWLDRHGQAIFETRPWQLARGITADGIEVRYTASADAVHAIVLGTPQHRRVQIDVRLDEGAEVALGAGRGALPWTNTPAGVLVELPEQPPDEPAMSLRMSPSGAVSPLASPTEKGAR